jgi:hypothetical protein
VTIELNPEQERIVRQAILAGLIHTRDDAAEIGIASIRERLAAHKSAANPRTAEAWSKELAAWSESHSATTPLLPDEATDRDSIYGAHGL